MRFIDVLLQVTEAALFQDGDGAPIPVIVADNIQRQIDLAEEPAHATLDPHSFSWPRDAYGMVAPPFPVTWIESHTEAEIGEYRRGVLLADMSFAEEDWRRLGQWTDATRWLVTLDAFGQVRRRGQQEWSNPYGHAGTVVLRVGEDGRLLDDTTEVPVSEHRRWAQYSGLALLPAEGAAMAVPLALMTISAMHRNAPVELVEPAPPPRHIRRQRERETGRPYEPEHSYYVLMVRPTKPGSFEEVAARDSHIHVQRRQHVVRGHFRYYHPDRPLFGRTSGMVWVPAHERGSDTLGTIRKDYELKE